VKQQVLVTGAAQGIGRAITLRYLQEGHPVLGVDKNEAAVTALATALEADAQRRFTPCIADLARPDFLAVIEAQANAALRATRVLINNAGYGGPFETLDHVEDDTFDAVFDTNVRALFSLCRRLLPAMKKDAFGRIVNIASVLGLVGSPGSSTYVASKHAVIGYTRAIAAEWGPHGITCNAVCPGYIDTAMGAGQANAMMTDYRQRVQARIPTGAMGQPDDVARMVVELSRNENGYLNGAVLTIDGGTSASLGL
jgi:3-oxoacyl-[acyl-carrier protein] reductase